MTRQVVVFFDDLHGLIDAILLAFDHQPRVVQMRAHVQGILEKANILIERAEEGFNLSGNVNGTSHPSGGFSYRHGLADGGFLLAVAVTASGTRIFPARPTLGETSYTLAQQCLRVKLPLNPSTFI